MPKTKTCEGCVWDDKVYESIHCGFCNRNHKVVEVLLNELVEDNIDTESKRFRKLMQDNYIEPQNFLLSD